MHQSVYVLSKWKEENMQKMKIPFLLAFLQTSSQLYLLALINSVNFANFDLVCHVLDIWIVLNIKKIVN